MRPPGRSDQAASVVLHRGIPAKRGRCVFDGGIEARPLPERKTGEDAYRP